MNFYLFDTAVLGQTHGLCTALEHPKKDPKGALMREEYFAASPRRWEPRIDNGYPNVFFDSDAQKYRCYYTLFSIDPYSASVPLAARKGARYTPGEGREVSLAYAESLDGAHWVKPALGLTEFEGRTDNNLLLRGVHGASVFYDGREQDTSRRYKMLYRQDGGERLLAVAFSGDGIHFDRHTVITPGKRRLMADSHNFAFYEEKSGRYVLISRHWRRNLRIVTRMESEDFIHWSDPAEVLAGLGRDDQIYSMPVFACDGLYIGLPSIYHGGDTARGHFDCVDCELAYSFDTVHWQRIAPGTPFIERSPGVYPEGGADCGCIYASVPVRQGDELMFYYMGGNGRHTNFRETSLMRATLKAGRLMSLRAGQDGGTLETAVLDLSPSALTVDAVCGPQGVRAQVCDAGGRPLPGYDFEHSRCDGGDGRLSLRWAEHERLPEARGARIKFALSDARVYSFACDAAFHNPFLLGL